MNKDYDQFVKIVPDRLNYDLRYYMLNDKAKKDLEWNPSKKIKDELSGVVDWYISKFEEKDDV